MAALRNRKNYGSLDFQNYWREEEEHLSIEILSGPTEHRPACTTAMAQNMTALWEAARDAVLGSDHHGLGGSGGGRGRSESSYWVGWGQVIWENILRRIALIMVCEEWYEPRGLYFCLLVFFFLKYTFSSADFGRGLNLGRCCEVRDMEFRLRIFYIASHHQLGLYARVTTKLIRPFVMQVPIRCSLQEPRFLPRTRAEFRNYRKPR